MYYMGFGEQKAISFNYLLTIPKTGSGNISHSWPVTNAES